jgi:hypothetical protein
MKPFILWVTKKEVNSSIILLIYTLFEDSKGVIRSRKSEHRQCNGQKKKDKQ